MELLDTITANITRQLNALKEFTATPGCGVTRFPYTPQARLASDYLAREMQRIHLQVRMDPSGSVIGRMEGESPETIMIGSHLDSVKNGGAYDGIAGAVCAIEVARLLEKRGKKPRYSVEVIATNDEEGSRFKSGLFTGKILLGQMTPEDLKKYSDEDGITIYDAMINYGLDPEKIGPARTDIAAFLETHIEQGPVMEAKGAEIGAVTTIVGIRRAMVTIDGRPDHVGTMPMDMRHDALETAAKVIAQIGDTARKFPNAVATVGNLHIEPNIINIVPSKAVFSVDFRGITQADIDAQYDLMVANLKRETERFGTSFTIEETLNAAPVDMFPRFRRCILDSCEKHGYRSMELVSGAGHDAQIMGAQLPTAMIFVPSIDGRSHCPEEKTEEIALARAVLVMQDILDDLFLRGLPT